MKTFNKNAKQKRGFTLIELIVVIAILAIIAAIAVPTAFASLENARAAACRANIGDMLSAWRIEQSTELLAKNTEAATVDNMIKAALTNCGIDITDSDVFKTDTAGSVYEVHNLCPSGGEYTITIVKDSSGYTGVITIGCDEHTGTVTSGYKSPAATQTFTYNGKTYSSLAELMESLDTMGGAIDSTAIGSAPNLTKVLEAVQTALGLDSIDAAKAALEGTYGMTSWSIRKNADGSNPVLRWSTVDVTAVSDKEFTAKVGPVIPVIKYEGGQYTLVAANIYKESKNGETYNIIRNSDEEPITSSRNYDEILAAYEAALIEYEAGTFTKPS